MHPAAIWHSFTLLQQRIPVPVQDFQSVMLSKDGVATEHRKLGARKSRRIRSQGNDVKKESFSTGGL